MIQKYDSFVYILYNNLKKMFYIRKHLGSINDGYIRCFRWGFENGVGEKLSQSMKGRKDWNKGLPNATAAENAKKDSY